MQKWAEIHGAPPSATDWNPAVARRLGDKERAARFGEGLWPHVSSVLTGLLFAGFSAPEGDSGGQGGWALIDTASGAIRKVTTTIPPADQARGFAGGGIWSTPAFDARSGYAYVGAGNPFSKTQEHPYTNSILKIDVNSSRSTFGQVVAHYKGNPDQYTNTLETLSQTPICRATDTNGVPFPLDDPAA
jgi:hypothetical protein